MALGIDDYAVNTKAYSKYNTSSIDTNVSADEQVSIDFSGYLKILTAQMANQDFNNAMDDSEMVQQMASYSMMEAINKLTEQTAVSYSASLIGKAVSVTDGSTVDTGIVEAVSVTGSGTQLIVNGLAYNASAITDVIDGDVYRNINSFVGSNIRVNDEGNEITGKATGVYFSKGKGYIVLDGKNAYDLNAILGVVGSEEAEENAETATVTDSKSFAANRTDETEGVTARSASERLESVMGMLEDEDVFERLTADVEEDSAEAGMISEGDYFMQSYVSRIPQPTAFDSAFTSGQSVSDTTESRNTLSATTISKNTLSSSKDTGEVSSVISVDESDAETRQTLQGYTDILSQISQAYTSTRKYADKYPLEAAFADTTGTHMGDIRFIGNTNIMNEINTDQIICYSQKKHRPVTDIGWCGIGRLGEVVTLADGRQRVEVIGGSSGKISYLYSSGNYTLSELFDFNVPAGYFKGKLTPDELALRHYAREYSASEQASLDAFEQFARYQAYNYSRGLS